MGVRIDGIRWLCPDAKLANTQKRSKYRMARYSSTLHIFARENRGMDVFAMPLFLRQPRSINPQSDRYGSHSN